MITPMQASIFHPSASLHWSECTKLPLGVQNAQCVLLNNKIYVGVGCTSSGDNSLIFESSTLLDGWKMYATPVCFYALTVFNSQLTLVGGMNYRSKALRNELWTSTTGKDWHTELPPKPTKSCFSSAMSTGNPQCLIVAGGRGYVPSINTVFATISIEGRDDPMDVGEVSKVEILREDQWFSIQNLPKPCCYMKSVIHEGVLYLMGGGELISIYSCSLDLLLRSTRNSKIVWSISRAPLTSTCPVTLRNHLLTVGGLEQSSSLIKSSSLIHGHFGCFESWKEVGNLPIELCDTSALELPSGELVVIGGFSRNTRSNKVYKACIKGEYILSGALCS